MGWWSIANKDGGIEWNINNKNGLYNGDGPADTVGMFIDDVAAGRIELNEAVKKTLDDLNEQWQDTWGRKPVTQELEGALNFVKCTSDPETWVKFSKKLLDMKVAEG